jgi:hypothetical protein
VDNLTHPHDSVVRLNQEELDQILIKAETVVAQGVQTALVYLEGLGRLEQATWFSRAHVLYLLHSTWDEKMWGEFYDYVSVTTGKSPETTRRMVEIWEWVIEKPKHSKRRLTLLLTKPPSGLWYVKQAAKEGQLGEPEWKQIETAHNKQELRQIMLDVRGEYRRGKDALKIMMEEDGILKARKGNKAYAYVGRLNVDVDDPIVTEAIERILNSAGIFRR